MLQKSMGLTSKDGAYAEGLGAQLDSSRLLVDHDYMPYDRQVGLTGRNIYPDVYLALGISGAIHHIAGVKQSKIIIAVNSDKKAPIFQYADYGVVCRLKELWL